MKRMRSILLCALVTLGMFQAQNLAAEVLRLMIWEGYFPEEYHAQFQELIKKKYGVDIQLSVIFVTDADEFYGKVRNKDVDIITPSHNLLRDERYDYIAKKLLLPITLSNVPNYQYLAPGLKGLKYHTEGGQMYAMPYANGPYGLAYNTRLVKEPPTSWTALLDPRYAGKYTLASDYPEVNIYIAALMAGLTADQLSSYEAVATPEVRDIIKRLRKNAGGYWSGVDKAADLKGKMLATSWGFSFSELTAQGEVWKFASPKEGTPWWIDNFAITWALADKPQLKKIAEELINFVISPEFQLKNVVTSLGSVPVNTKTALTPSQKAEFRLDDDPATFTKRRILWPTLSTRTRNGYNELWAAGAANAGGGDSYALGGRSPRTVARSRRARIALVSTRTRTPLAGEAPRRRARLSARARFQTALHEHV